MARLSVEIPSDLDADLDAAVERGEFGTKDEAVVQALEVWRMPDLYSPAVVEKLRALVAEADAGGPSQPWDVLEIKRRGREALARERASREPAE